MRFRKKPVVIEAVRWTGDNASELLMFMGAQLGGDGQGNIVINTRDGAMLADVGDWIIRGIKGEFYPCKPDIFEATYEPANE